MKENKKRDKVEKNNTKKEKEFYSRMFRKDCQE